MSRALISSRRLVSKAAACLALAVTLASTGASYADVFDVAPKDALGVFRVRNIGATAKKFSEFATKLDLVVNQPELADPIGAIKTKLNIKEGLNESGDAGIILLPASKWPDFSAAKPGQRPPEPAMVILVPVSDYAKFIANLENATTEGDLTTFKGGNDTMYVRKWGDYAAIAPENKDYVANPAGEVGVKVNAFTAKELEGKDAVLWANVAAMKAAFGPKLAENKDKWLAQVDDMLSKDANRAKYSPVAKAAITQGIRIAETFLNEAQGATVSFDVSAEGVRSTTAAEFSPDSYIGKFVNAIQGENHSPTAGLPAGNYLYFGGLSLNGPALLQVLLDIGNPILDEFKKVDPANAEIATKFVSLAEKSTKSLKSANFGLIAPNGTLGQDPIFQMAQVVRCDANEMMKLYDDDMAKLTNKLMEAAGSGGIVYTYKKADKTLDGVTFDSLIGLPKENPQTVEEGQVAFMSNIMYGPAGAVSYFGAVDDKTLVSTLCLSDADMSKLIAAAKADSDDLGKKAPIAATTKALPEKSLGIFYISIDEIMKTVNNYAGQQQFPINLPVPDGLSPFGFSVGSESSTLRFDSYLPADTLKAIVDAGNSVRPPNGGPGQGPRRRPRPAPAPAPAQ